MTDESKQHVSAIISDDDSETGAAWGGLGGAVVGATAGSVTGPVGSVVGAVVGGLAGAGISGAVVGAIDQQHQESGGGDDAANGQGSTGPDSGGADQGDDVAAEADVLDVRYNAHHSLDDAVFAALHGRKVEDVDEAETDAVPEAMVGEFPDEEGEDVNLPLPATPDASDPLALGGATRDRNTTESERIDNTTY